MPKYTWYAVQVANEHGVIDDHSVWHQHETDDAASDMLGGFPFPGFLVRENSRGDRRFDFGGGWKQTPEEAVQACKDVNELDDSMPVGARGYTPEEHETAQQETQQLAADTDGAVKHEPVTVTADASAAIAALNAPEAGGEDVTDILQAVAETLGFHQDDMDPTVLNAEVLAEVRKIVATVKPTGSRSAAKIAEMSDEQKVLLDNVAEAIMAKVDGGRRDWQALGGAIRDFDKATPAWSSPDIPTWTCPVDVWNALTGYQRFLCMTGHNKTGWAHGGPRTIFGVKCPSHTGSGYDKQRDRLKTALEALGLTCGETIMDETGQTLMLNVDYSIYA